MLLDVVILSPQQIIFEGQARSVILPGEEGIFEITPLHKRIISRLLSGMVYVDEKTFSIKRGLIKAGLNNVTVIVEET
jgi:F-type H+-transporting ATPase subunit epsilon